jgi:hypothetical protein
MKVRFIDIVFLIVGLSFLAMAFMIVYPYNELQSRIDIHPFPVVNCPCAPGQVVEYRVVGYRSRTVTLEVSRQLVGENFLLSSENTTQTQVAGEFDFLSTSYTLPDFIQPGEYYLRITTTIRANPIRDIITVYETEPFEVR